MDTTLTPEARAAVEQVQGMLTLTRAQVAGFRSTQRNTTATRYVVMMSGEGNAVMTLVQTGVAYKFQASNTPHTWHEEDARRLVRKWNDARPDYPVAMVPALEWCDMRDEDVVRSAATLPAL